MENLIISQTNSENLEIYSELLKKDKTTLVNEALVYYFEAKEKMLLENNLTNENAMTNLDYDEFWDGVDL